MCCQFPKGKRLLSVAQKGHQTESLCTVSHGRREYKMGQIRRAWAGCWSPCLFQPPAWHMKVIPKGYVLL